MTRSLSARLLFPSVAVAAALAAFPAWADMPHPWGIWTQEPASTMMEKITALHDALTVIIVLITVLVFVLMGYAMYRFDARRNPRPSNTTHNAKLEVIWTLIPILILVGVAFPSFRLLYAQSRLPDAKLTLKVTGHQWYWSYAFPDEKVSFDSNLVQDADLKPGEPRLLTADNPVVLPINMDIRILITADDVIHSWSVPALGVKTDAVPGRLNETWVNIIRTGTYYGQCSQLCGINHGFMPIEVQGVEQKDFQAWLGKRKSGQKSSSLGAASFATASSQR